MQEGKYRAIFALEYNSEGEPCLQDERQLGLCLFLSSVALRRTASLMSDGTERGDDGEPFPQTLWEAVCV